MAEFYNKYRRLFTEPDHPQKNLNAFTALPNTYKTPSANHIDRYFKDSNQEETIFKRQQKIGRSPALDEVPLALCSLRTMSCLG
jgi:xanthine dehydrogenase molybdopterin-binding subunit B